MANPTVPAIPFLEVVLVVASWKPRDRSLWPSGIWGSRVTRLRSLDAPVVSLEAIKLMLSCKWLKVCAIDVDRDWIHWGMNFWAILVTLVSPSSFSMVLASAASVLCLLTYCHLFSSLWLCWTLCVQSAATSESAFVLLVHTLCLGSTSFSPEFIIWGIFLALISVDWSTRPSFISCFSAAFFVWFLSVGIWDTKPPVRSVRFLVARARRFCPTIWIDFWWPPLWWWLWSPARSKLFSLPYLSLWFWFRLHSVLAALVYFWIWEF